MALAAVETAESAQKTTVGDRVAEACSQVGRLSQEAHKLTSKAAEAIENATQTAQRVVSSAQHRVEELGDLKEEAIQRVKRQPLQVVGAALGIGLVLGVAIGWSVCRPRK